MLHPALRISIAWVELITVLTFLSIDLPNNLVAPINQGEALADKNSDLPNNLVAPINQGEALADKNPDLPNNLVPPMLHPYSRK